MNLEEIETFLYIAKLGSFSKASTKLHRTQPALSRRIRLLERSLGATLFDRVGRSVALTHEGSAFLPHAEAIMASLRDGRRAVDDARAPRRGARHLSLGIVGTLADSAIVDALGVFKSRERGISVSLTTGTSREVSRLVRNGEAELGLRYFADHHPNLISIPLGSEKLYVVVSASHRIRAKRIHDLRQLTNENWLGFPKDRNQPESFGHLLERELSAAGAVEPKITPVDSLTAQKRLVQAGFGVTLMPLSSCREELRTRSLRTIDVANLKAELPIVVVRRKDGYTSKLAESFLQLLKERVGLPRGSNRVSGSRKT